MSPSMSLRAPPDGGGCFPFFTKGASFFFSLRLTRGGDRVYITLEQLLLLASFIVALLVYVQNHNNKKK